MATPSSPINHRLVFRGAVCRRGVGVGPIASTGSGIGTAEEVDDAASLGSPEFAIFGESAGAASTELGHMMPPPSTAVADKSWRSKSRTCVYTQSADREARMENDTAKISWERHNRIACALAIVL